jgi:AcrR family transcriptional regulator/DNA-binding MarR family transcriptional regulator
MPSRGKPQGSVANSAVANGHIERERVIEIQRARMLAATFDVVSERGVGNVSVAHVVARSGVSRRTFYELFTDREDCFLAAFEEAVRCGEERMLEAYAHTGTHWSERVRAGLEALLCFLEDEPSMGRLLVVEALAAGPRALARRQQVLAPIVAAVDRGRGESRPGSEPSPLTAEGVVGAVFSVIHTRMLEPQPRSLLDLAGPLMSMIVLPYLGVAAARRELDRPSPRAGRERSSATVKNPLRDLEMRLTYRTVRVLLAIAAHPGSSNRRIADVAEVNNQGQMSKLLARLEHLGLIENNASGGTRGEPNAWTLTSRGRAVEQTIHTSVTSRYD